MNHEQQEDYEVPSGMITALLFGVVIGALVVSFGLLLIQLALERARMLREAKQSKARRLRLKQTKEDVQVPELESCAHFHVFLSHVWGTGQDQMRIVKQRLVEMMPNIAVFLDVRTLTGARMPSADDRLPSAQRHAAAVSRCSAGR